MDGVFDDAGLIVPMVRFPEGIPFTDQVTAGFLTFCRPMEKFTSPPGVTDALVGLMLMEIPGGGTVVTAPPLPLPLLFRLPPPPLQAQSSATSAKIVIPDIEVIGGPGLTGVRHEDFEQDSKAPCNLRGRECGPRVAPESNRHMLARFQSII